MKSRRSTRPNRSDGLSPPDEAPALVARLSALLAAALRGSATGRASGVEMSSGSATSGPRSRRANARTRAADAASVRFNTLRSPSAFVSTLPSLAAAVATNRNRSSIWATADGSSTTIATSRRKSRLNAASARLPTTARSPVDEHQLAVRHEVRVALGVVDLDDHAGGAARVQQRHQSRIAQLGIDQP